MGWEEGRSGGGEGEGEGGRGRGKGLGEIRRLVGERFGRCFFAHGMGRVGRG